MQSPHLAPYLREGTMVMPTMKEILKHGWDKTWPWLVIVGIVAMLSWAAGHGGAKVQAYRDQQTVTVNVGE